MENVVKFSEKLGQRHLAKLQDEKSKEAETEDLKNTPQIMKTADLMKFSRENAYVSYHDVLKTEGLIPVLRRFSMTTDLRKNYGRLVPVFKALGLLENKKDYRVKFHSEAMMFEILSTEYGNSELLIKTSECAQVWDW